jgi:peptidoglycan-N-acetylglucosamine deacetylase
MARAAKRAAGGETLVPKYATSAAKEVWLTFDDGPHPTQTDRVLKTLEKSGIKATFFLIGENAKNHKQIAKKTFDAGHRVGNHTYTHPHLSKLTEAQIRDEIKKTEDVIADFLGKEKLFRPPYGDHNAVVDRAVASLGYRLVTWNVDTLDWDKAHQPDGWVQLGLDQIRKRDKCVVLNHDIHKTTADNLQMFIDRIKQIGNVTFMPPSAL